MSSSPILARAQLRVAGAAVLTTGLILGAASVQAQTSDESAPPMADNYTIAFALGVLPSSFGQAMYDGANAAAIEAGSTLVLTAPPQAQPALQIAQLDAVFASQPDFLIIQPDDATALVAPMQKFKDAGIPAITIDTDVADPSLRLGNITGNNVKGGTVAAETMNSLLGGEGKVLYIGYVPGATTTDDRLAGWQEGLQSYPGLVSLGEQFNQSSPEEASAAVTAALTKDPDLAGIFASDENSAIGAATAVQAAGRSGDIKIVGFDAAPSEVTALRRGTIDALIIQDPFGYGNSAAKFALDYLANGTLPPEQTFADYAVATQDNLEDPAIVSLIGE
jgi:ribose transport system substrate-binding protein